MCVVVVCGCVDKRFRLWWLLLVRVVGVALVCGCCVCVAWCVGCVCCWCLRLCNGFLAILLTRMHRGGPRICFDTPIVKLNICLICLTSLGRERQCRACSVSAAFSK